MEQSRRLNYHIVLHNHPSQVQVKILDHRLIRNSSSNFLPVQIRVYNAGYLVE